jgi:hypothetical protein
VTHSERPLAFRDSLWARPAPRTALSVRTMVLVGALVLYALGFVALYAPVHASVLKSEAEGNDPALVGLVGP